ncbi:MAG TPA: maleylpyruvate isomerase family mycothiol-dependent enzyme [Streptosporangiaceae bacterium]|nr:maleylpyruvate isomerase family mycothiol-dependent enzyme [Streptosporangiaceae bacterium]
METDPGPWIRALRHSHDVLRTTAEPLTEDQLRQRSYASEWSIAQVLSHLGSQAEIFELFLDAGLTGQDPPGMEQFRPIWEIWDGKEPQAQAADALRADDVTTARFESLTDDERARLRLKAFGRDLDVTAVAGMRLSEHAMHTWDVAVALDPAATVEPDAVALLVDTVGQVAPRGKPDGQHREVLITTTSPERHFLLETGETITLTPADGTAKPGLELPAEALLRLVYGRLDPDRTPPVEASGVDLDELRAIFPGF